MSSLTRPDGRIAAGGRPCDRYATVLRETIARLRSFDAAGVASATARRPVRPKPRRTDVRRPAFEGTNKAPSQTAQNHRQAHREAPAADDHGADE